MPYRNISELPPSVKDNIASERGRRMFMHVVNAQLARGLDDSGAFASAWSALQNAGYTKDKDGIWRETEKSMPTTSQVHVSGEIKVKRKDIKNICNKKDSENNDKEVDFEYNISKMDEDKRLVFGWASVAKIGNEPVKDKQGDIIPVDELESTAYDFVLNARIAGENHSKIGVGSLVESMVFTEQKQKLLKVDLPIGWWVGFYIHDSEVWDSIKNGAHSAFSIGGFGRRSKIT